MVRITLVSLASLLLCAGCSSSKVQHGRPEMHVEYVVKNALQNTESRIEVSGESLTVYHRSVLPQRDIQERFTPDTADVGSMYGYLEKIKFHEIQQPKMERMLDAPDERITATFLGRTTTLTIGSVKELPEGIVRLRTMILDLAVNHSPAMKKALGH
jgi:hypothetical protein